MSPASPTEALVNLGPWPGWAPGLSGRTDKRECEGADRKTLSQDLGFLFFYTHTLPEGRRRVLTVGWALVKMAW